MGKPVNPSKQAELKTQAKRSHNQDSLDERIVALVRLMARCAAEEDYRNSRADHNQQNEEGGK